MQPYFSGSWACSAKSRPLRLSPLALCYRAAMSDDIELPFCYVCNHAILPSEDFTEVVTDDGVEVLAHKRCTVVLPFEIN